MIMTVMVFEMISLKKNDALKGNQYIENEILNLNCSICQLVPPKTYGIAHQLHIYRTQFKKITQSATLGNHWLLVIHINVQRISIILPALTRLHTKHLPTITLSISKQRLNTFYERQLHYLTQQVPRYTQRQKLKTLEMTTASKMLIKCI